MTVAPTGPSAIAPATLDRRHLFILDRALGRDRLVYENIRDRDDLDYLIQRDLVHPEAAALSRYQYQVAGTINYGPLRIRADSPKGEGEREAVIRKLMSRLRIALDLRGKDLIWVATTEYGYGNRPHGHFLVSFDHVPRVRAGSGETQFSLWQATLVKALADMAGETGDDCLGELVLAPVTNSLGAVAYLSKEEYRRPFKHFMFSTGLI